ncbi:siderophore-interacting protein [Streptomyces phaeochromogenes]|uniref:siderophore-interacting protein n=1 Tax=Streptomyces phaeochromogenes TaxID=1923 RepID=UPI002DDA06F3|nr:siderophore-interacting protein [Streptomyces phaeochromogenes]WRZ26370.1 siderophore-interacting protein [Streptomyces phaeochromogenes]WSJ11265.1 siderophore-interacting protein [Streptomyces phaeochromogenes]
MTPRIQRPRRRQMLSLTVQASEQISPHFMSITLGGDDIQHLDQSGFDQSGRLFFAAPDDDDVFLPSSERWILQLTLQSTAKRRPRVRTYSIRRFRPQALAFDIEISLHESNGSHKPAAPGTRWALAAQPGAKVAFLDEGYSYAPTAGAAWQLLVGDESALPAIASILERSAQTPEALPAEVFLEVPAPEDVRDEITAPPGTTIHWLPRPDPSTKPGALALEAVKQAQLPDGRFYTWTAGESSLATGVRRHLVGDRHIPKSDICFRGYFSHGRASL